MSLLPIIALFQRSGSRGDITNIAGSWPSIGLGNFVEVVGSAGFIRVAIQTLIVVVDVLAATLGAGFIAALLLRSLGAYSVAVQTTLILVWTLPLVVVGAL